MENFRKHPLTPTSFLPLLHHSLLTNLINLPIYQLPTAGQQLQIFNLELKAKMKNFLMPAPVSFWRWISPNTIGTYSSLGWH